MCNLKTSLLKNEQALLTELRGLRQLKTQNSERPKYKKLLTVHKQQASVDEDDPHGLGVGAGFGGCSVG